MAKHHGKNGTLTVKPVNSGTLTAVGEIKKFTLETACETIDAKVLSSEWDEHIPGIKSWNVSLECHFDSANQPQALLYEGASVELDLRPHGTVRKYTGKATVISTSIGVENAAIVSISISLKGNGTLTPGAV